MSFFQFIPKGTKGVVLVVATELLLAAFISFGVFSGWRATNKAINELSELADPSPFRAALMGHLGRIHVGLQGFLRSGDESLADQAATGQAEFESALVEFQKQSSRLFPPIAMEEIRRSFADFKKSIAHTREADTLRQNVRRKLDVNFARILSALGEQVHPLIREKQADWEERREAALNIENQARAWQQNLVKAWAETSATAAGAAFENDNRGSFYLDQYARLHLLARELKVVQVIKKVWQENSVVARQSLIQEKLIQESEAFMDAQRGQVVAALNKYLPAMSPADLEKRKTAHVFSMRLAGAMAVTMGIFGLVSIYFFIGALRAAVRD